MKLPLVSRKKYNILKDNYDFILNQNQLLRHSFKKIQEDDLEERKQLGNELQYLELKLSDTKKEISNLKRLLTKNGIEYKKEKK